MTKIYNTFENVFNNATIETESIKVNLVGLVLALGATGLTFALLKVLFTA